MPLVEFEIDGRNLKKTFIKHIFFLAVFYLTLVNMFFVLAPHVLLAIWILNYCLWWYHWRNYGADWNYKLQYCLFCCLIFLVFSLNAFLKIFRLPKTILSCFEDNEFHFIREFSCGWNTTTTTLTYKIMTAGHYKYLIVKLGKEIES